ncbi:hypothetical protein D6D29_02746 [Aureobasidium pullulans]|nr:hypothetical protein D6D29_02746 [Aureobasidium pullulans]
MEKMLTHLEAAKTKYSVVRPAQDYSMFNSQASTVFEDSQDLNRPAPLTRFNLRRNQSSQLMPPPPAPILIPRSSPPPSAPPSEPIKNTLEYRMLCVGVNLAWKKLDEYYTKTDQSPVYVAAVVLHPRLKWKWLKKAWKHRQGWLNRARTSVRNLWLEYANIEVTDEDLKSTRVEDNARWMDEDLLSDFSDLEDDKSNDEYSRWCDEGRQPNEFRPLEFWSSKRQKQCYPRLARMARDLFTIPAMSDEPERVFSSAGLMP